MKRKPDFQCGQKVDEFQLQEPVGGGQDGEVWKAVRLSIGKCCALKFLNKVDSEDKRQRFDREIRILASLDHAHVVSIQGRGDAWNPSNGQTVPYYVMEFIPGVPIKEAIVQLQPEERLAVLCTLFQQLLSAVEEIHRSGVSHGDIKSANVLVLPRERIAKLSDFGFGLLSGETRTRSEYPASSYRAPEHLTPEEADLYRVGKTLSDCLECLPASMPRTAQTGLKKLVEDLVSEIPRLSCSDASGRLKQIQDARATSSLFFEEIALTVPELDPGAEGGTVMRDSIYGDVFLSPRSLGVIESLPFQHLRERSALPNADIVYPSMRISLSEEVIGEYAALRSTLIQLMGEKRVREFVTAQHLSAAILCCLVRKIGMPPYAAQLLPALRRKDVTTTQTLAAMQTEPLREMIAANWGIDIQLIGDLLRGRDNESKRPAWRLMSWLMEHPVSPCQSDWIRRVSQRCAMPMFDIERLHHSLSLSPAGDSLVVQESALPELVDLVRHRSQLFERVLFHRAVRAADLMLEWSFRDLAERGFDFSQIMNVASSEFLTSTERAAEKLGAQRASYLLSAYRERRLFKQLATISLSSLHLLDYAVEFRSEDAAHHLAAQLAHSLRVEQQEILVDPPYMRGRFPPTFILSGTRLLPAAEASPIMAGILEQMHDADAALTIYGSSRAKETADLIPGRFQGMALDWMRAR